MIMMNYEFSSYHLLLLLVNATTAITTTIVIIINIIRTATMTSTAPYNV